MTRIVLGLQPASPSTKLRITDGLIEANSIGPDRNCELSNRRMIRHRWSRVP